jgi:hypothetical protein
LSGTSEVIQQANLSQASLDAQRLGGVSSNDNVEVGSLTAALTRVLDPVLPAGLAEVVVSPLLLLELLWRAISSSGRGIVVPISLLGFSAISLLWDRRRSKALSA